MPGARPGAAPGEALANDPANPCVGCGPEHPWGLRLSFRREGEAVRAALATTAQMAGWPERVHTGLLYLALLETANWTVYGLLGRVGVPAETSALEVLRMVPVGSTVALEGRLAPQAPPGGAAGDAAAVDAVALVDGAPVARLRRAFAFPARAAFLARMGYAQLPAVLEDAFPA